MVYPSIASEIKGGIVLVKAAWHIGFLWVAAAFQRAAQQGAGADGQSCAFLFRVSS
jgi:hypothetical protein